MQPEQPPVQAAGAPLAAPDVYDDSLPVQQRVWRETQPPPPPPTPARRPRRPRVWLIRLAVLLAVVAATLGAAAISSRSGHGRAAGVAAASLRPTTSPASSSPALSPSGSASPPAPVEIRATLLFPGDSATPDPAAQASISSLAARIRPYRNGSIEVNGYTATLGTGGQNEYQLSLGRAQAVAGLLRQTLAGTAITVTARGFGAANPVAPNSSEAGRAHNRRVEIVFTTAA